MQDRIKKIVQIITEGEHFLVASHLNPDGDAIGSSLALALALEEMDKEVVVYNHDHVPFQFDFLPSADRIVKEIPKDAAFDAAFVLDCSEPDRVGKDFETSVSTKSWINIDHHLTNEEFADVTMLDSTACATGFLVYQLIKALPVKLTKEIAENIYTTILVDTGSFRYSNATNEAFSAAGEMVDLGVSPWDVANKVYENQPHGRLKLLNHVLDTLNVVEDGKIATVVVTEEMMKETGTDSDATDGFVNYPRSIEGVEVAVMIREIGTDEYKISYRSKGKVNVAEAAQKFNGGGHRNAAGCVIKGKMNEVRSRAIQAVCEVPSFG